MKIRSLRRFDGKCVRITDSLGDVFEGGCDHLSPDYCMHEFGRDEEGLQMLNFIFYKDNIAAIEILEDRGGPWGCFSGPYGTLELMNAADGKDFIDDVLDCEDNDYIVRMLRCLEALFEHGDRPVFKPGDRPLFKNDVPEDAEDVPFVPDAEWRAGAIDALHTLIKNTVDPEIKAEAERIAAKAESTQ